VEVEPVAAAPAEAAQVEVEPVAAVRVPAEAAQAGLEPVAVEPVVAEPEAAAQAGVERVAVEAVPEVAEASIGRSSRSLIALKRLPTTSRHALPARFGAPRSTSACSAAAVFYPTPK
jgi:hypothetical protein